ncbi:Transcription initiation factor IIF subunit alpha [Morus notabilis]|uniref:Transcription initiation factor IIF subunit alpha n=1 Tax=Morus notabilis TaxID=981085 RepID=W9QUN0_9ROSA|nr:Transcription initiation factor IIF subunit alpha [Morus notabilis]
MSMDLILKPSCSGCGSASDLYGSNCKHMTLCLTCGKTMAENHAKCYDCGATVTRLIREYNVRASTTNDKNYFIGRFVTGLPNFSRKKNAENRWSFQKDGLQGRQITDALRVAQYKQLTLEEAEEKMKNRKKTADGYQRWMMKAANNGPAAFGEKDNFDDKDSGAAGGRGRRKASADEGEGNVSDKGDEDEEDEVARKNRLGLNKRGGDDDDEEGPRGDDLDLDDDDIEKGDDWEHEEIFTDDDEAVGNDPEEREDLAPEVPAPPEIKQDEDDEDEDNEEEGGLSKSGKELKKLLGRAGGLNDSDAEDDDDSEEMDEDIGVSPTVAPKQKDAVKEEPAENSPAKPTPSASAKGTPTTSKSAKGKRKLNGDDVKPANVAPSKKVKTENEQKPSEPAPPSKNNVPSKGTPSSSTKAAVTSSAGPVTEEEIRAVLIQKTPVTTQDLVAKFRARLRTPADKNAFAEILRRISKIQKTNGSNYVVLREK